MDLDGPDAKVCNGTKPSAATDHAKGEGLVNGEGDEEHRETETESLLASKVNGGLAVKRQKSSKSKRKVQWNDRNGNRLVEVLEFEPSDSSDSENEYGDSCPCNIL